MIDPYDAFYARYKQYGPVYTIGIPGTRGFGSKSLSVVCVDPIEYLKVLQNEGRNPYGALPHIWSVHASLEHIDSAIQGFATQGEEWRRLRMAAQISLVSPSTVNGYMSAICKAAANTSPAFESKKDQVMDFIDQCSFDVFYAVCFGQFNTAIGESDSEHERFCQDVNNTLSELGSIGISPKEILLYKMGWISARFLEWAKTWKRIEEKIHEQINGFLEKKNRGELNKFELSSYLAANLTNSEMSKTTRTQQEFKEMIALLLIISVDPTTTILS